MTRRCVLARLALAALCCITSPALAATVETPAREAILMDYDTGHVLFAKNAEQRMPPASMTKIMTTYLVFERLKEGRLSLDDTFVVSRKAWRKGGSKMFVEVGNEVTVEDLLQGVIVQSGNDASIVLAEGIAGTTEAFAKLMTKKAQELGMDETTFKNSTGWPHPEHRTSADDLAILSRALIQNFPTYYEYFAEREFTWNDIRQFNRNPLLGRNMGVDGIKTGHTQNAGYGLTASAERKDRRLILVVNGLESAEQRADESARLLEWGFREFDNYTLFEGGETVEQASVWLGQADQVPLVVENPLTLTMKRDNKTAMTVKVTYEGPIPAPIESGERLATLHVRVPGGGTDRTVPLVAGASVPQLGPIGRIVSGVEFFVFGAP